MSDVEELEHIVIQVVTDSFKEWVVNPNVVLSGTHIDDCSSSLRTDISVGLLEVRRNISIQTTCVYCMYVNGVRIGIDSVAAGDIYYKLSVVRDEQIEVESKIKREKELKKFLSDLEPKVSFWKRIFG